MQLPFLDRETPTNQPGQAESLTLLLLQGKGRLVDVASSFFLSSSKEIRKLILRKCLVLLSVRN